MKNSFFLVIPAQETSPDRLKEYEPKALEQWLIELPTANPGLATRLIQDYITNLNTLKLAPQERLDVLEKLRPKVVIIIDYLRSRLTRAGFPKEENDFKILNVLTAIEREFTTGYWIALKELTHRQISWFQGKNLALTLQRCIKGLSGVVISHYIMGLPIPDWVWIDLHSLHKLSITLKKETVKIPDETNVSNKASSPQESYLQILLLSLCRPSGLMQKEILQVYGFIENLFSFFSLKPQAIEEQQFQFAVLTDEDRPPFVQIEMRTTRSHATFYLDLTRLYKAIERKDKFIETKQTRFASIHLKNQNEKPTEELLEYLEQRWLGIELQRDSLFSDRLDRFIAIGIAPAHSLQRSSTPLLGSLSNLSEDEQEFLVHSESDRLLFCVFNTPGILSVGNLISIRRSDQAVSVRSLAVINELIVSKKSNRISFGINTIAASYHAVLYLMANATSKDTPLKGLFYSAEEQSEEASFLIIDNFMIKDGDSIKMQLYNENIFLLLKNKKNIGLGYWQFECNRVAENIQQQTAKKGYDFI